MSVLLYTIICVWTTLSLRFLIAKKRGLFASSAFKSSRAVILLIEHFFSWTAELIFWFENLCIINVENLSPPRPLRTHIVFLDLNLNVNSRLLVKFHIWVVGLDLVHMEDCWVYSVFSFLVIFFFGFSYVYYKAFLKILMMFVSGYLAFSSLFLGSNSICHSFYLSS